MYTLIWKNGNTKYWSLIVLPIMEYACTVWFPHTAKNINTLERVQLRAARWAAGSRWMPSSYTWSKPSDDCLKELQWPSIHQRHTYFSICQVHDIFHSRNSISFSNYFHISSVHSENIRPVSSTINSYRYSFFVNSSFLWNKVPLTSWRFLRLIHSALLYVVLFFDYCMIFVCITLRM